MAPAPASASAAPRPVPAATAPDEPAWLASLLAPACVAVIGADPEGGGPGQAVLANLLASPFDGMVFPVSATHRSLQGVRTTDSLAAIPERIDLAIVATPAESYHEVIAACSAAGVANALLLGNGLWPDPLPPATIERIRAVARKGRVRLLGPDSLGLMNPHSGFNGSLLPATVKCGGIAFLSQSGSLCSTIVDWSRQEGIGFSGIVSLGSMIDVGWADLIEHYGNDPRTRAILLAVDEPGDARAFLSAARSVAMDKPIIAMRSHRVAGAGRPPSGSMDFAGDELFDALLARAGVLSVAAITDLFGAADLLGNQPRPAGNRLAIVTNAGSPALQAADLVMRSGNGIATLARETTTALARELAAMPGLGSGVGVLADPPPACFAAAARLAADDPACDGLLLILSPQGRTEPTETAQAVIERLRGVGKPVFASWMGGPAVEAGRRLLHGAGIPHFEFPDAAARAWNSVCVFGDRIRDLYETPEPDDEEHAVPERLRAQRVLEAARREGRTRLAPGEVVQVLSAYHLVLQAPILAVSDRDAGQVAEALGFPVRLTPHLEPSCGPAHGKETFGDLMADSAAGVRVAFHALRSEVQAICGATGFAGVDVIAMPRSDGASLTVAMQADPVFGPVVGLGLGGALGGVYADHAYALPPLTMVLARRLLARVRLAEALQQQGASGPGTMLAQALVRFSHLVIDHPRIESIVLDSVSVRDGALVLTGARIGLHRPMLADADLPRPLVRPYPLDYGSTATLRDGTVVDLRPVRPEDEPAFVRLHEQLSAETVRLRYAAEIPQSERIAHGRLARRCQVDYDREIVLVAEVAIAGIGKDLIGVGRLTRSRAAPSRAAISVLVADRWQPHGLDAALLDALLAVAGREGLTHLTADFPSDHPTLCRLLAERGFIVSDRTGPLLHADLLLA